MSTFDPRTLPPVPLYRIENAYKTLRDELLAKDVKMVKIDVTPDGEKPKLFVYDLVLWPIAKKGEGAKTLERYRTTTITPPKKSAAAKKEKATEKSPPKSKSSTSSKKKSSSSSSKKKSSSGAKKSKPAGKGKTTPKTKKSAKPFN
jgi:hypothetical protein